MIPGGISTTSIITETSPRGPTPSALVGEEVLDLIASQRRSGPSVYRLALCFFLRESLLALRPALSHHKGVRYCNVDASMPTSRFLALLQECSVEGSGSI